MAKKNQSIYAILGAAVGTGLAVYGIRRGMQWYQRRQMNYRFDTQPVESSWPAERRYQPMEQPGLEPIPATGPMPAAPPMTGMTSAERVNSDMVGDFDDRGTASTASEMNSTRADELAREDTPITGSMTGSNLYGGATETPGASGRGESTTGMGGMTGQTSEIIMDEFVAPLIEHAIALNSVMNLLRSRQRDGEGYEGTESLTEGDRTSMRNVLEQMQEHVAEYDEMALRKNPLAQRSHNLTRKMRDALDNLSYTGSDLYRIYTDVGKELCSLSRELENSGQVTITGLDQIRQLYEC